MLVLSRKEDQTIIFPNLGISVEVIRVNGKNVRIGIDAPRSIRIVRGELINDGDQRSNEIDVIRQLETHLPSFDMTTRHELRNHLNEASLSVHVAQKHIERGEHENAEKYLVRAIETLDKLNGLFGTALSEACDIPGSTSCKPAEQSALTTGPAMSAPWSVLVVEDNDNERELLAGVLEMSGFDVTAVADGLAAIEFLETHERPDIVLIDMQMPRMDGPQTIKKIRNEFDQNELSIIGVSGLTQSQAKIPTGDRGVTAWFSKPVNPNQLVKYLQREIESKYDTSIN